MNYYKIAPEWAEKLNVAANAPCHPDGWYLILQNTAYRLALMLKQETGEQLSAEDAVIKIGGCIYTESEALASQRGEEEYMMKQRLSEDGETIDNKDNPNTEDTEI